MEHGRVPPQHHESEQALLGSMLLKSEVYDEVIDIISSEKFFYEKIHRIIFEAIQKVVASNNQVDSITVGKQLEDDKKLSSVGGRAYLAELTGSVPSASHATTYARTVANLTAKRNLIQAGEEIVQLGYENNVTTDELFNEAESKIFSISDKENKKSYAPISRGIGPLIEHFIKISENKKNLRGIPTGFPSLDRKLSGFQESDLIIIAARPSVGKTSLGLDIVRRMALKNSLPVGIFSLEMSNDQLIERMIAGEAYIDAWTLRNGRAMKEDSIRENVMSAADRLGHAPIYIDDRPGLNILSLRSTARRMKREHGVRAIIVDYLQLLQPHITQRSESLVQQVTEVSRTLKHIARELSIPVIALSQLSREVEKRNGEPRLSDLRESGAIEQDADVVMFLHRQAENREGGDGPIPIDLIIAKHRNGPIGRLHFSFNRQKITFEEYDNTMQQESMVSSDLGDNFSGVI